jgi:hypothetical protein
VPEDVCESQEGREVTTRYGASQDGEEIPPLAGPSGQSGSEPVVEPMVVSRSLDGNVGISPRVCWRPSQAQTLPTMLS